MDEHWNIGLPGGPAGPFYSIVSSKGRVIALQVPDRETAESIVAMKIDNARLREALEAVEWEIYCIDGLEYCAWCSRSKEHGHDPDCKRQQALEGAP